MVAVGMVGGEVGVGRGVRKREQGNAELTECKACLTFCRLSDFDWVFGHPSLESTTTSGCC